MHRDRTPDSDEYDYDDRRNSKDAHVQGCNRVSIKVKKGALHRLRCAGVLNRLRCAGVLHRLRCAGVLHLMCCAGVLHRMCEAEKY